MTSTAAFYQLDFLKQADSISKDGLFLMTRQEGNFVVDLYELHDLLIEIYYQCDSEEPVSVMAYNANEKLKSFGLGNLVPRLIIRDTQPVYQKSQFAA